MQGRKLRERPAARVLQRAILKCVVSTVEHIHLRKQSEAGGKPCRIVRRNKLYISHRVRISACS